jgi:hypothetical protein
MKVLVCDRCSTPQPAKEIGMWYRLTITGGHTDPTYSFSPVQVGNDLCPECAKALAQTEDWIMLP